MTLATERDIQQAYSGEATAARYVRERFATPLYRLLHEKQVAAVQQVINRTQPQSILEIAPGPGRVTRDICPSGRLVCLEFNEGMIAEGQAVCGDHVEWVQGNAFALPFGQLFDFVYSFRFIRHFHREDRNRLYAQIRRVLRPGGHFLMDAVNIRISKPLRDAHPHEYPVYDELHSADALRDELHSAGFKLLSLKPVQKHYGLQSRSQVILGPRANWLNNLVIRGLELLPARDGLEWIVTCRRA
jgi:SAM-dependent methyltransferase